jgi:hypothetical protein
MADDFDNEPKGHFPDLKRSIRSIQCIEGNPECFGEADGYALKILLRHRISTRVRDLCLERA